MKYWFVLLFILGGCSGEYGVVEVGLCPECLDAYDGFSECAFFDSDWPENTYILDQENYHGTGMPVSVRGYMHHKFCFNDSHSVFGSANPTRNGLAKNDNLVVRIESETMAENFASEYAYLLGAGTGKHTKTWRFNDKELTQLFCPRDDCEDRILEVLDSAQHSIVFLSFSFTSDPIADLLIDKHEQGVCVSGIVESRGSSTQYAAYPDLRKANIPVFRASTPGVMHHKVFLIDNTTAIVGSYNPSKNANENNAETVVIIREPLVVQAINGEYARLMGGRACSTKRF